MHSLLHDLGLWFWRLVPANPILVRVVQAGSRRTQHLLIRLAYLGFLAVGTVIGVVLTQQGGGSSLAELAKSATSKFEWLSRLQLGMVCILAPIFTAAAITQEKDSQTFSILLSTPLTNGQIVFGSLLSRLYFVFVLLLSSIPLFCIMMVYGGVTGSNILISIGLCAATAAITGSLAISISVIRIGTGRTIFTFYLAIAIYLIALYTLGGWTSLCPPEAVPAPDSTRAMSWLAAFHPFLALNVALGRTPAPDFGAVVHYGFPGSYLLAYPHYSYIALTFGLSALVLTASLVFVRRGSKVGEPTFIGRLFGSGRQADGEGSSKGERKRKPRHVGHNPVAWRETATSASATGGALMRYSVIGLSAILAVTLLVFHRNGGVTTDDARAWVWGLISVELGVALFISTATAATSMTREKESNTLELLLVTPITSGQIVWGKIRGLILFAVPMLIVPYLTVILFLAVDALAGPVSAKAGPVVAWESLITLPVLLVAFTAIACIQALSFSIKCKRTITAVFWSGLVLIGMTAALSGCGLAAASSDPTLGSAIMPFGPISAIQLVIHPATALGGGGHGALGETELLTCRMVGFISSMVVAFSYGLLAWGFYRGIVQNFDMTIRKQTA